MANPEHLEIVLKGTESVNQWHEQHQYEHLDLSNADLSGIALSKANLYESNLSGTNLSLADLTEAILFAADLSNANLSRASLSKAMLANADLSNANLSEADLSSSDLSRTNLYKTNLHSANLSKADLVQAYSFGSDFSAVNLTNANLVAAGLINANLSKANLLKAKLSAANLLLSNLSEAVLSKADLTSAYLSETDLTAVKFTKVICNSTTFANCNLSDCQGLESVIHQGPSSVGIDTLMRSIGAIPEAFLRGAGVPDTIIDFFSSLAEGSLYYTCFISYGSSDAEFADRLYQDLAKKKVRCWKYDKSAVIGRGTWANIDRGISSYDKVIVICSKDSLNRTGVLNELERALQKEDSLHQENARRAKEAKDKGEKPKLLDEDVLCPVRLDNYVFDEWQHSRKADVIKRHIGDFQEWKTNKKKYNLELKKLLQALDPKSW